jgi:hypothetical protein
MYVFSWLDNRTLIACDLMLALAFAFVFFGMKRSYPNLRGINTIAISFLLGVPGHLSTCVPAEPFQSFLSVTIAHTFVFGSFIFPLPRDPPLYRQPAHCAVPITVSCFRWSSSSTTARCRTKSFRASSPCRSPSV